MIIVRSYSLESSIENNFDDNDMVEALEYHTMLEEEGYDNVSWVYLPGLSYEKYIQNFIKINGGFFKK